MGSGANIGDVSARLTLEGGSFDATMAKAEVSLDRHGALSEKASERARAAWEKELVAQDKAQRSLDQLNRSKELAALKADILARSVENEARAVETAGHASVSQMQATSAAVRSLEGNPGIRAVERFLTTIPGVGKALMAAFPVVGAVAFGAVIVEMGSKVVEFVKSVQQMPKTIEQAFAALNLSQRTTADELDLTTDKIQNQLDKLAGKPENNLKVAFDEAKLAADRLAGSIEASNTKLNELLSKNHISGLATLFGVFGTVSTAGREGTTKAFGAQANSNAYDLADATSRGDTAGIAKANKALLDTQNAQLAEARKDLKQRQDANSGPAPLLNQLMGARTGHDRADNSNVIADDKGIITTILNQQREDTARTLDAQKQAEKQVADDKKAADEEKKRAAAEAQAAANKAAQERLRAMEVEFNTVRQQQSLTIKGEYDYWVARTGAFKAGSSEYASVVAKASELAVAGARQSAELIKRFQDSQAKGSDGSAGIDASIARLGDTRQRDAVKTARDASQEGLDSNQLFIANARNQAREQEARVTDEAGRSISRYAAAIQMAQIHAEEFKAVMEGLQSDLSIKQYQNSITPSRENAKAVNEAQVAVSSASSQRSVQSQADQDAIYGRQTSAIVGATDALNDFIIASKDSAAQMKQFTSTALSGFNAQVVRAVSGQRTHFSDYGAGLARNVAGTALQKGEGSLLSMVGLGGAKKPTGSKGDPLYVAFAASGGSGTGGGGSASAAIPGLLSGAGGSSTSTDGMTGFLKGLSPFADAFANAKQAQPASFPTIPDSDWSEGGGTPAATGTALQAAMQGSDGPKTSSVGMTVSSLVGMGLKMLPMFAEGGMIDPDQWAIVGEQGPELFHSGGGGAIVPNRQLNSFGSGDTHNWNIDARGATDPAQVHAQIMAAAPHIAALTLKAGDERQRRSPSSKR